MLEEGRRPGHQGHSLQSCLTLTSSFVPDYVSNGLSIKQILTGRIHIITLLQSQGKVNTAIN